MIIRLIFITILDQNFVKSIFISWFPPIDSINCAFSLKIVNFPNIIGINSQWQMIDSKFYIEREAKCSILFLSLNHLYLCMRMKKKADDLKTCDIKPNKTPKKLPYCFDQFTSLQYKKKLLSCVRWIQIFKDKNLLEKIRTINNLIVFLI